jgi:hypothetical protein
MKVTTGICFEPVILYLHNVAFSSSDNRTLNDRAVNTMKNEFEGIRKEAVVA